nr:reverse transcriptase domain-containing protein [Tanacetum cinerariifolium]
MRTRPSSNLPGESSPNLTSSNPKRRNRRRLNQPFILKESPVDTMADQCTMAKLLRIPTEGYVEAIVVPPILAEHFELKYSLINMMTSDQFFGLEKDNSHDHIRGIEYLLNHDPIKEMDSILEGLVDEGNLAEPNDNLVDTIPEMFSDEHALDYSSPPLYDEYDDSLDEFESDNDDAYDDPFESKGEKIKESKLLIDELDLPRLSDFLPSLEYDSFLFEDFSEVYALPSANNEDKVFNPVIFIQENLFEVNTHVAPDKNVKKIAISYASLILKDFNPPLYELPFYKEVLGSETLLSFSSKNEE